MSAAVHPWLYVLTDKSDAPRHFLVQATDYKAAEDLAFEHSMNSGLAVVNIVEVGEWIGADCVEITDIRIDT